MIQTFFDFLREEPFVRWVILSCALCLTALFIWWPKNWVWRPFKQKACASCKKSQHTQTLDTKPEPIAPPNPQIYRKSIFFNKKNVEFDITFEIPRNQNPEKWKQTPHFLEDPLHPNEHEPLLPKNYTLQIRCIHTLSPPERDKLHHYLKTEGYIEDAEEFYNKQ